jgi:hypothetical protein
MMISGRINNTKVKFEKSNVKINLLHINNY